MAVWKGRGVFLLAGLLCGGQALSAAAETVEVRLEAFPPLVREEGSGLLVDQLRALEEDAGLEFNIEVVSYSRAKFQLRNGQADLIGLIPVGRETDDFYGYARELEWRVETRADLYAASPESLQGDAWKQALVGTPWGNAAFFSQLADVPVNLFVESSLANLVQMTSRGRLPVMLFERAATLNTLRQLEVDGLYYRNLFTIPAGLAVRDDDAGRRLGRLLDGLLPPVAQSRRFRAYRRYQQMPDRGRVTGAGVQAPLILCGEEDEQGSREEAC